MRRAIVEISGHEVGLVLPDAQGVRFFASDRRCVSLDGRVFGSTANATRAAAAILNGAPGERVAGALPRVRPSRRPAQALTTNLIRSERGLTRLLSEWWGLWHRSRRATPFQSPAWLHPWWLTFRPGRLFLAAVRRHGALIGLAPLYLETGRHGRRLLPLGIGLTDYLDLLVDPAHGAEATDALFAALAGAGEHWDAISLEDLRPDADALGAALPPGFADEVSGQHPCPVADLAGLSPAPSRRIRRAVDRFGLTVARADGADAPAALDALFRLHAKRWRERGEAGVLADPRVQAFHRAAVPGLAAAGLLRFYLVRRGDALAGAYYGLVHGGRAYGYLSGFDPAHEAASPGAVLIDHAMREAAREGCTEFDFLRGPEPYKYAWGAVDRWTRRRVVTLPAKARASQHGRGRDVSFETGAGPAAKEPPTAPPLLSP